VVWVTVHSTADDGDELVTAHMREHQKIRNIRRDPRVAVTIVSTDRSGPQTPYPSIKGTARVEEGGAPELLDEIATTIFAPGTGFPPPGAPPGYLTHSLRFRNFAQPSELIHRPMKSSVDEYLPSASHCRARVASSQMRN
jgi:hypothetical protein